MATIGKSAFEVEKVDVPRGIVHQRKAFFAGDRVDSITSLGCSTPSFTDHPSTSVTPHRPSVIEEQEIFHSDTRRHVSIEVTRLHAPAELVRRSPDDDVSQLQRRVVLLRHSMNQEPSIKMNEVYNASFHPQSPRRFPIVSVRVGEHLSSQTSTSLSTEWKARVPPMSFFRQPGTGPVHKTLTHIRPIEGIDTVTFNVKPVDLSKGFPVKSNQEHPQQPPPIRIVRKAVERPVSMDIQALERKAALEMDDLFTRESNVDEEIVAREEELEKAKQVIMKLSQDLEKLENDRKTLRASSIVEETDLEFSFEKDDKEDNRDEKVRADAEEILRECTRMMGKLKEEEEADALLLDRIQRGESNEEEIQREILRLQRQNSVRSNEDRSQIVSLKDQAVMFSTGASTRQEALISRLERELTDAQTCNHRLNAQLGTLANNNESTLKKEFMDIQKTLKERNDELDTLRKKVQKAEKDRQQWDAQKKQLESKLPVDVQLLLAQKKELTTQLNREQMEKQELFMQMNLYIAQLAECGDADALKEELNDLQKRYKDLQDRSALLEQDLSKNKYEVDAVRRGFESEKRQLQAEADDARKELEMKSAALQSLMLAKQDNTKLELLTEENKRMQSSLEEYQNSLKEAQVQMAQQLTNKLDHYHTSSFNAAQEELQKRLDEMENRLKAANEKADVIENEKKQLQRSLDEKTREIAVLTNELRDVQQETHIATVKHSAVLVQLQTELNEVRRGGDDDMRKLCEREKILQMTLDETSAKLDATKVALLSAESRAVQAESDLKALDSKALNAERRVLQLQEQLSAAGNEEREMELLRDQLRKSEERHEGLLAKHQKAEAAAHELENNYRVQIEGLQQRLEFSERDHREVMEKQTKLEDTERHSISKLYSLEQLKQQIELDRDQQLEKVHKLEKELEQARFERQNQKSSVAEEITTLTNMTSSLRNENEQYQGQISRLERDIHELKGELEEKDYENEQLIKELEQTRAMADTERQTMVMLKSSQLKEEESISTIKAELTQEKEARRKAETDLASKFGAELEELSKEKSKIREEKTRLENELAELRQDFYKLEEESISYKSRAMEEEARFKAETSRLQTNFSMAEDSKRNMEERLREAVQGKEEFEQQLERKLREAKEETEAFKREAESQKFRVRELEEEKTREVGSNDEQKKRLMEELRFFREKADSQELEVSNLKSRIISAREEADTHLAKAGLLQTRLDNLQAEYEEMKQVLHSTKESAEKMKESEQLAAKIKRQLVEIENEHRERLREEQTRKEELERKIDELTAHSKQQEMRLLASSDTQREELEAALQKNSYLESRLKEELEDALQKNSYLESRLKEELESALQKNSDLESRLVESSKSQSELLQNVKNLTALVESESKRIEEAIAEKRKWQSKAEELERQLEHSPHADEMNRLVTENARLAGEILTLRAQHAEANHSNSKAMEDQIYQLKQENQRLVMEMDAVRSRTEELNRSLVQADKKKRDEVQSVQKELERERQERERLQDRIDNMYQNGHPTAPSRTLSNMSGMTSMTTADFTEIDDVDQLHKMMDKQQRIIKVLRRKLLKMEQA